jgi:hypothetical protein
LKKHRKRNSVSAFVIDSKPLASTRFHPTARRGITVEYIRLSQAAQMAAVSW